MNEKREVVIIGGGNSAYVKEMIKLLSSFVVVKNLESNILCANFGKIILDEYYSFDRFLVREEPIAHEDYDHPKSQKPWKAGYIPQHGTGPSYYPSSLLLSLVDRVK